MAWSRRVPPLVYQAGDERLAGGAPASALGARLVTRANIHAFGSIVLRLLGMAKGWPGVCGTTTGERTNDILRTACHRAPVLVRWGACGHNSPSKWMPGIITR